MANYINFPAGFNVTTNLPVDKRLVMTKAEMLAAKKAQMPDYYLILCSDDQKLYVYDKSIETPTAELGRFRHAEDFFTFTSEGAKQQIEAAIENSAKIQDLDSKVGDAETAGTLVYNVNELQENVDTLTTDVSNLEVKVEDPDTGLIKRVDKAQTDISEIETWIQNVKLDGGEIKAVYTLSQTLTNVVAEAEDVKIEYKVTKNFEYNPADGYELPSTILVNNIAVGPAVTDCGTTEAKWVIDTTVGTGEQFGTLTVSNTVNNVTCVIVGIAK